MADRSIAGGPEDAAPTAEPGSTEEQRRQLAAARAEVRELRAAIDGSPDALLRFDRDGRCLLASRAAARLLGASPDELVGPHPAGEATAAAERLFELVRARLGGVLAAAAPLAADVALVGVTGPLALEVRLVPERGDGDSITGVLAIVRDVTAQREAEATSRAGEERVRELTEVIDDVFWLADPTRTQVLYVSPAFERVFGMRPAVVQADGAAWLAPVVAADRARLEAAIDALPRGYDLEYRIRRGRDVSWIRERAVPIRDPDGTVRRIAGISEDITRHRSLEEQLRQAQKVEAVGQLAGGIAHDFNNLLAVILMQASVLADRVGDGVREGIDEIISAAQRASTLTRSLLALSRKQSAQPVLLDLGQAVAGATQLLRRKLGVDVLLETHFDPGLPMVHADPGMIEQVLTNLVTNARDAMTGGGRLTVAVRAAEVDADRAAPHPGAAAGRHVALAVADSGPGIAADVLPHIFEPFFTTKDGGTGTGLGLPMVLGLVQQHRGWVEVDSEVGRGTTVTVLLPAADPAAVEQRSASPRVPVRGGSEIILLVEDEPAVRTVTRVVLQRYGYRVLEAESAVAALAIWDAQAGAIDLLLTDLVMPGGMSGRQLADTLLTRRPGLPIIYMSSYSRVFLSRVLHFEPRQLVLPKPCTAAELAASVRRCLDE